MKKLILGFLLSLGLTSALFAQTDLIALATNGVYNKQSKGVKVLSDEEMAQIVGGYTMSNYTYTYYIMPYKNNYNANKNPQTNNQKILSNAFMKHYR